MVIDLDREGQNDYAEKVNGDIIYIDDAESGKKGYFCIGCKHEMQAVKSNIVGRKSYFRHDATDINHKLRKCTFSNQTYRHEQAILILNRIKKIKVPALYKYPPIGTDGLAIKITEPEMINAAYTKAEITFYETEEGEVTFGKNPNVDTRYHLIRPDVTLFNHKDEPILLVEIVVTHRIDSEKLAKIKKLGLSTVQIIIPRDSLENIEKSFFSTKHTKWIYHHEQESTKYLRATHFDAKGISQIDELQRELFNESFECRQAQVNNLIRAITKCLESEQYATSEQDLRREIFRVEGNTKRTQEEYQALRKDIRERVRTRFEREYQLLTQQAKELETAEGNFAQLYKDSESTVRQEYRETANHLKSKEEDLEKRYLTKRDEILDSHKELEQSIWETKFFEQTKERIREEQEHIEQQIRDTEQRITEVIQDQRRVPEEFREFHIKEELRIEEEKERITTTNNSLRNQFETKERNLIKEFENLREQELGSVENGNYPAESDYPRRIKEILKAGRIFDDWNEAQNALERNRAALECFNKGTYKNWD